MINTPDWTKPRICVKYPSSNETEFERYFYESYQGDLTDREYLPIFWTGYYVNNSYGQDMVALQKLQDYIDALDKSKKYFTIIQYDDAILNRVSSLDLYQFNMSKPYDYPLPLIGEPYPYIFTNPEKKYLANFIGGSTHPIREHAKTLIGKEGYYISFERHDPYEYCKILSESVFTLCYRGYGINSFRISEALQSGSIPVYISDDFIEPHNVLIDNYGIKIPMDYLNNLGGILQLKYGECEINKKSRDDIYKEYFTYDGTRLKILEHLQTIK